MKFRSFALLAVMPAFIAGTLVAAPAEAASKHSITLGGSSITISSKGGGKVLLACKSNKSRCKGKLSFSGGAKVTRYSIKPRKSAYVSVAMKSTATINPNNPGAKSVNKQYSYRRATLKIDEDKPRNVTRTYRVSTQTRLSGNKQQVVGTVKGSYPPGTTDRMTQLKVELMRKLPGGTTQVVAAANVTDRPGGNTYRFNVSTGINNGPSGAYQLRLSGVDRDKNPRSYFWRGHSGAAAGGGRYIGEATTFRATKTNDYKADFTFSSIYGTSNARSVTVAAPPVTLPRGADSRRELDLQGCANVYAETNVVSGAYRVDFLPYRSTTTDRRYMIGAKNGKTQVWNGSFGTCLDVVDYHSRTKNLLAIARSGTALKRTANTRLSHNTLVINGRSKGFSPTSTGDRWIRLREKIPNVPILASPVIIEGSTNSKLDKKFTNVPPGKYWVEVGRRTGCSRWVPSKFSNNNNYFNGIDRSSEKWKTVSGRVEESKKSVQMGYKRKNPPRGYKGWMYREVCKALGAGSYNSVNVTGMDRTIKATTSVIRKGAVVKGHISRAKGRTNKEMLVRLTTTSGTRVVRADLTDGSGNFYVAGLASGKYTISVNSDSWRGIGRKFTGHHTITVKRGKGYNAGTLKFKD